MPAYPLILVAEDDPTDQFLLRRAIERAGLEVQLEFVKDGYEAVKHLQKLNGQSLPALLLLDLNMPGMDGFEVLEWLRQHSNARPPYVAVLSASCNGNDLKRACLFGVDHYLVKPADPAELVATLKRLEPYLARKSSVLLQNSSSAEQTTLASAA